MTNKGLNHFDDCAAKCVYLCLQEEECTYSKIYTPGTIANSKTDRTPTKTNPKNGAVFEVIILVELGIL